MNEDDRQVQISFTSHAALLRHVGRCLFFIQPEPGIVLDAYNISNWNDVL